MVENKLTKKKMVLTERDAQRIRRKGEGIQNTATKKLKKISEYLTRNKNVMKVMDIKCKSKSEKGVRAIGGRRKNIK